MLDCSSLERIIPDQLPEDGATGVATLDLHLERYTFAAEHMRAGTLLDIACGVGYGTSKLTLTCPQIRQSVGVDLSGDAVRYASQRYANERISWIEADAMRFDPAAYRETAGIAGFDNIVSLETIEHLPDPLPFFRRIAGLLNPGGILVASVPTTPSMDGNPHHLSDFTEASFRRMADGLPLEEVASFCQVQPFSAGNIVAGKEKRLSRSHADLLAFYAKHPGKVFTRVASTLRYGFVNRYLTVAWKRKA